MRSFVASIVGLGLIASVGAVRTSDHEDLELAIDSEAELAGNEGLDQSLWLTADCLDYPVDRGFKVGDFVRVYKVKENGTFAGVHNRIGIVRCFDAEKGDAEGRVCLQDSKGCWLPDNLRHMSPATIALMRLSTMTQDLAVAVAQYGQQKFQEHWPGVQAGLATFANVITERLGNAGAALLAQVNPCDPEVRAKVSRAIASAQAQVSMVAASAKERWPEAQDNLETTLQATGATLATLVKKMKEVTDPVYRATLQEHVEKLETQVSQLKNEVQMYTGKKADQVMQSQIVQRMRALSNDVADFSGKVAEGAIAVYQSDAMQLCLSQLQAGAGKLRAFASERWEKLKPQIDELAADALATVQRYGEAGLASINLCDAEVRATASDFAQKTFGVVESHLSTLVQAVQHHWPEVKQSMVSTALYMQSTANEIANSLKRTSEEVWKSPQVQTMIAEIQVGIEQLHQLAIRQASAVNEASQRKAKELTQQIQAKIEELTRKTTNEEAAQIEDEEDIADSVDMFDYY